MEKKKSNNTITTLIVLLIAVGVGSFAVSYTHLAFLVAAVLVGVYLLPEEKTVINEIVMTWLPYFVFIM